MKYVTALLSERPVLHVLRLWVLEFSVDRELSYHQVFVLDIARSFLGQKRHLTCVFQSDLCRCKEMV